MGATTKQEWNFAHQGGDKTPKKTEASEQRPHGKHTNISLHSTPRRGGKPRGRGRGHLPTTREKRRRQGEAPPTGKPKRGETPTTKKDSEAHVLPVGEPSGRQGNEGVFNFAIPRSPVQTPRGAKSPPTKRGKKGNRETTNIFEPPPARQCANQGGVETQIPQHGGPQRENSPTHQMSCTHENSSQLTQETPETSDAETGHYANLTPVEHNVFSEPLMPSRGRSLEANLEATIAGLQGRVQPFQGS